MKQVRNLGFFVYKVYRRLNRVVPVWLANKLAVQFKQDSEKKGVNLLWLRTYDGSSQCAHPHVVKWKEKLWLVVTPYPYGMSAYENPCMYSGTSIDQMCEHVDNPVDIPKSSTSGTHFSDPCLYSDESNLYCFYRESRDVKQENGKNAIRDTIFLRKMEDNLVWGPSRVVMSEWREVDELLSPAFLRSSEGSLYMAHIRLKGNTSQLVFNNLSKGFLPQHEVIGRCYGLPEVKSRMLV